MRFHTENLTDGRLPLWRDGRLWFGDWGIQWGIFRWFSWFDIKVSKGGISSDRLSFHIVIPWFYLFVHRSFARRFRHSEWGAYWYHGSLAICLGSSQDADWEGFHGWHKRPIYLPVKNWITGKPVYSKEKKSEVPVLVPMPEGCYEAVVTEEECCWAYRFGFRKTMTYYTIEVRNPGGIPFEGKGESGYDCGTDGICSLSSTISVEDAIGKIVASALRSRRRYGNATFLVGNKPIMADPEPSGEVSG